MVDLPPQHVYQIPADIDWRRDHGVDLSIGRFNEGDGKCEQEEKFETIGSSVITCVPLSMVDFVTQIGISRGIPLAPNLGSWYSSPNLNPNDSMYGVTLNDHVNYDILDDDFIVIVPSTNSTLIEILTRDEFLAKLNSTNTSAISTNTETAEIQATQISSDTFTGQPTPAYIPTDVTTYPSQPDKQIEYDQIALLSLIVIGITLYAYSRSPLPAFFASLRKSKPQKKNKDEMLNPQSADDSYVSLNNSDYPDENHYKSLRDLEIAAKDLARENFYKDSDKSEYNLKHKRYDENNKLIKVYIDDPNDHRLHMRKAYWADASKSSNPAPATETNVEENDDLISRLEKNAKDNPIWEVALDNLSSVERLKSERVEIDPNTTVYIQPKSNSFR